MKWVVSTTPNIDHFIIVTPIILIRYNNTLIVYIWFCKVYDVLKRGQQ
jgi:hypothetical protein